MDDFTVDARVSGPLAVVTVSGDLDAARAPALREKLQAVIGGGATHIVLDLRRVTFIESVALGVIVAARRQVGGTDKSVCIVLRPDQQSLRKVFEMTGLDKVLPVHPNLEAAEEDCADDPPAA